MDDFSWSERLPTLVGERVNLRWLTPEDAEDVFEIFSDPDVMQYWSSPPMLDRREAPDLLEEIRKEFEERRLFQWGISLHETGRIVGTCTLTNLSLAHRRAEIGFALGRKQWGKGIGSEAVDLLVRFSFEALGLHRLEADTDPGNERSLRLLENQGFKREGYLRERWHHLGEVQDGVFLGLLASEWPGANRQRASISNRSVERTKPPQ